MDVAELAAREFEQVVLLREPAIGLTAWIAIHSTRMGPAFGGVRRWAYPDPNEALADALRLAEAMSLKCASAGIPGGGGKAVLVQTPELQREAAYRLVARHVELLGGRFCTGPDVGTEPGDLAVMAQETRFVAHFPSGPVGEAGDLTAGGVLAGIAAVAQRLGRPGLAGTRVLVQGLGGVGLRLVEKLVQAGAQVIVADLRRNVVDELVARLGVEAVDPVEAIATPCDVFAPCALGGVVDDRSLPQLQARAIAGSANNVLAAPAHGQALFERGILYAPDFVINAGALVHGAWQQIEGRAPAAERIAAIGERVGELLDESRRTNTPPEVLAERRAREWIAGGRAPWFPPRTR